MNAIVRKDEIILKCIHSICGLNNGNAKKKSHILTDYEMQIFNQVPNSSQSKLT